MVFHMFIVGKCRNFKYGSHIDHSKFQPKINKITVALWNVCKLCVQCDGWLVVR